MGGLSRRGKGVVNVVEWGVKNEVWIKESKRERGGEWWGKWERSGALVLGEHVVIRKVGIEGEGGKRGYEIESKR